MSKRRLLLNENQIQESDQGSGIKFLIEQNSNHLNLGSGWQLATGAATNGSKVFTPSEMEDGMVYQISIGILDAGNLGSGSETKLYALIFDSEVTNLDSRVIAQSNANYQTNDFIGNVSALIVFRGANPEERTVDIRTLNVSGVSLSSSAFRFASSTFRVSWAMNTTINQTLNLYFKWSNTVGFYDEPSPNLVKVSTILCKRVL